MSIRLLLAAADVELYDDPHIARLLILIRALGKRTNKPVPGIGRLAKLDFFLRYPLFLERALVAEAKSVAGLNLEPEERDNIAVRMSLFRYGPWDSSYRRWLSIMEAKALVQNLPEGKSTSTRISVAGLALAERLSTLPPFQTTNQRSKMVAREYGDWSGAKLVGFINAVIPELTTLRWS